MKLCALTIAVLLAAGCSPATHPPAVPERFAQTLEIPAPGTCESLTGDVLLSGQADVDAFGTLECTTIVGSLRVQGADSVQPLDTLREVTGDLVITELTGSSLSGLDGVEVVGGALRVIENPAVTAVSFSALTSVGDVLVFENPQVATVFFSLLVSANEICVEGNERLVNIVIPTLVTASDIKVVGHEVLDDLDLSALMDVTGQLDLRTNESLTSIDGLTSLQRVGGSVILISNGFTSLTGLFNLTDVGSDLIISNHSGLTKLSGLALVMDVPGDLVVRQNNSLTSLQGLQNVQVVSGRLAITRNPKLPDLAWLDALAMADSVQLDSNSSLTTLSGLGALQTISSHFLIRNNDDLTTLKELTALTALGGDLVVERNSALPDCEVTDLAMQLTDFTGQRSSRNGDTVDFRAGRATTCFWLVTRLSSRVPGPVRSIESRSTIARYPPTKFSAISTAAAPPNAI